MSANPSAVAAATTQDEPVERRMFQFTDLVDNHNKFYLVELWHASGNMVRFRATWGRVGAKPQVKEKVVSRHEVERQVAEKLRKGYRKVDLHRPEVEVITPEGEESSAPPLDPRVTQLIEWVFTEAGEHIQSFLAVEVEALSQAQINEGRRLLAEAQRLHTLQRLNPFRRGHSEALATAIQSYYNAIPTKLPARVDREQVVLDFCKQFSEQEDRLLQLEAAIATMKVQRQHPGFSHYQSLGAEIEPLSLDGEVYRSLARYIETSQVHGYKIRVRDVFAVCVPAERKAYEENKQGTSRRELLFHGSRNQNIRHILRQGLICPVSPSNGRMLGNGIYLANKSSKSANYCSARRPGVPHMLLVVEAALGKCYVAPQAAPFDGPPTGYDSVCGLSGRTLVGGLVTLMNDEFVVYSPAQQTIRYLVTFDR